MRRFHGQALAMALVLGIAGPLAAQETGPLPGLPALPARPMALPPDLLLPPVVAEPVLDWQSTEPSALRPRIRQAAAMPVVAFDPAAGQSLVWTDSAAPAIGPKRRAGGEVAVVVENPLPQDPAAHGVPVLQSAGMHNTDQQVMGPDLRPRKRPARLKVAEAPVVAEAAPSGISGLQRLAAMRPLPRPDSLRAAVARRSDPPAQVQAAAVVRPAPGAGRMASPRGSVCGVPGLKGEMIAPIVGRLQGCGVARPVRITEVGGIRLSQAATIDCDTARALHSWVETGLKPAFGATGGGISGMHVAAHYSCRSRNNRPGAAISEHGRGKGIDIAGLTFANGRSISVLRDWRGAEGAKLKAAYRAACGIFGTTLGPGSDGYHEDHMHFDSKVRRQAYCR